jgi:hypothetical protein
MITQGWFTVKSSSEIKAEKEKAFTAAHSTGRIVTPAEQVQREQALLVKQALERKEKAAERRKEKAALKIVSGEVKGDKAPKPEKPAKAAVKPAKAAPVAPVDPVEAIWTAVQHRFMAPGEGAIHLAALKGTLPAGMTLEQALRGWTLGMRVPFGVSVPQRMLDMVRETSGILSPEAIRTYSNPLLDTLKEQLSEGVVSVEEARRLLVESGKSRTVMVGDRKQELARSAMVSVLQVKLPKALILAPAPKPEQDPSGKVITVTYWTKVHVHNSVEEARAGEIEGQRTGTAASILAWAVTLLKENPDHRRVKFNEGQVLTLYYNEPTENPEVRALLGHASGPGIVIKRQWIDDSEEETATIRAHAKGTGLMAMGLKVGVRKYEPGQDPSLLPWPSPLKPGQYTEVGTAMRPLKVNGVETGEKEEVPALILMQRITSFSVDNVLRRDVVYAGVKGTPLPAVESTVSADGKRGGQVMDKAKNYSRDGGTWQRGGNCVAATLAPDYRIGAR